jgi:chromosome segregation ATPase
MFATGLEMVTNLYSEREVRKVNRELNSLLNKIDGDKQRVAELQTRYSKLLSDMKRTEREYAKAKKRGDLLQKEKETGRSELIKVTAARDKLDKISRNMAEENKKLRVSLRNVHACMTCACKTSITHRS